MKSVFRPASIASLLLLGSLTWGYQAIAQTANQDETASTAPSVVDQMQDAFVSVADRIKPSVVTIYSERLPGAPTAETDSAGPGTTTPLPPASPETPTPPDDDGASLGSGMVLDNQGHILTNYHVVKDAAVIRVSLNADADNPPLQVATLVGYDEESDLAVLQVPPSPDYQPVQFGDSDALRTGEWVVAVGAPFDQAQTVTVGVVSAKGRHLTKDGQMSLQEYLQTDASINPGNSGGPLVDMQGKVIGVNTAILSPARYSVGIGFAVPSNTITRLLPVLLAGKHVARGFLGIRYLPLAPGVAAAFGVSGGIQIGALAQLDGKPFGPAFDAGLNSGDIITAVNGQPVTTSDVFRRFIATLAPGTVIQLDVLRPLQQGVQRRTFEITLSDWNENATPAAAPPAQLPTNLPELGLQVENTQELTASQRSVLGQPPATLGKTGNQVIITHVRPGSPADDIQLYQGQIIASINVMSRSVTGEIAMGQWQPITGRDQLINIVHALPPQTKMMVQVQDNQGILLYKILFTAIPATP